MDFINKFDDKLEHKINSDKTNLSTGEKQRIALARTIILEPEIIIFDEALSNIDETNKKIILKNLQKYDVMKIYITHNHEHIENSQTISVENSHIQIVS